MQIRLLKDLRRENRNNLLGETLGGVPFVFCDGIVTSGPGGWAAAQPLTFTLTADSVAVGFDDLWSQGYYNLYEIECGSGGVAIRVQHLCQYKYRILAAMLDPRLLPAP